MLPADQASIGASPAEGSATIRPRDGTGHCHLSFKGSQPVPHRSGNGRVDRAAGAIASPTRDQGRLAANIAPRPIDWAVFRSGIASAAEVRFQG